MFQSASFKLTGWYLLIIMLVSLLFSVAIYSNVSNQIEGLIRIQNDRLRNFQFGPPPGSTPPNAPPILSPEDLQQQEWQLVYTLVLINLGILVLAGGAGYFLAKRTLRPISLMVNEQNQFISDASHELRTPIATLRAEMEEKLLEKHISDEQARKLISSNLEELETLQSLSNSLLKLARVHTIDSGDKTKISLLEVIQAVRQKVMPLARKKHINLVIKIPETIVVGNKNNLTELFVILLDNAIKYSPEHSEVSVTSQILPNNAKVFISDHGIGISQDDLPHIFERFFRADKSRSLVEGYGLGLSIAKRIIEQHKGSISATSKVGKGSVFEVVLPLS